MQRYLLASGTCAHSWQLLSWLRLRALHRPARRPQHLHASSARQVQSLQHLSAQCACILAISWCKNSAEVVTLDIMHASVSSKELDAMHAAAPD